MAPNDSMKFIIYIFIKFLHIHNDFFKYKTFSIMIQFRLKDIFCTVKSDFKFILVLIKKSQ